MTQPFSPEQEEAIARIVDERLAAMEADTDARTLFLIDLQTRHAIEDLQVRTEDLQVRTEDLQVRTERIESDVHGLKSDVSGLRGDMNRGFELVHSELEQAAQERAELHGALHAVNNKLDILVRRQWDDDDDGG